MTKGADGMDGDRYEARIAKLEADVSNLNENVREIRADLREMRADVGTMRGDLTTLVQRVTSTEADIKHLPRKGFIVSTVTSALAVFGAIVVFQHQIQQAIGLATLGK